MLEKLIFRADFFLTFFFFFRRTIVAYRFAISKEDGAWMEDVLVLLRSSVSIETKSRITFESFVISKDRRKEDRFRI